MNLKAVYAKLEKLREYAERNCGNETENAIRIIEKLKKQYGIEDFTYTPYTGHAEREAKRAQETQSNPFEEMFRAARARQAREEQQRQKAREEQTETRSFYKVSYTSTMKNILISFIKLRGIYFTVNGNTVEIRVTSAELAQFNKELAKVKAEWKRKLAEADDKVYEWMNEVYA